MNESHRPGKQGAEQSILQCLTSCLSELPCSLFIQTLTVVTLSSLTVQSALQMLHYLAAVCVVHDILSSAYGLNPFLNKNVTFCLFYCLAGEKPNSQLVLFMSLTKIQYKYKFYSSLLFTVLFTVVLFETKLATKE